jgi:hypothetical protein
VGRVSCSYSRILVLWPRSVSCQLFPSHICPSHLFPSRPRPRPAEHKLNSPSHHHSQHQQQQATASASHRERVCGAPAATLRKETGMNVEIKGVSSLVVWSRDNGGLLVVGERKAKKTNNGQRGGCDAYKYPAGPQRPSPSEETWRQYFWLRTGWRSTVTVMRGIQTDVLHLSS